MNLITKSEGTRATGGCRRSDSRYRAASQLAADRLGRSPRAALADSLALGYYRPPLQGFHLAASPAEEVFHRWFDRLDEDKHWVIKPRIDRSGAFCTAAAMSAMWEGAKGGLP